MFQASSWQCDSVMCTCVDAYLLAWQLTANLRIPVLHFPCLHGEGATWSHSG